MLPNYAKKKSSSFGFYYSSWQNNLGYCNKYSFSIAEPIFCLGDKLLPVYNMASSGLKKMLFYIILKHPKGVWENVFPTNILFFGFFTKSFLRLMLCLF